MKKKLLTMLLSSVVAVSFVLPFSVSAASPMKATAKAGDAVVDGVISEGEYADPFVLNGDNGATWAPSQARSPTALPGRKKAFISPSLTRKR